MWQAWQKLALASRARFAVQQGSEKMAKGMGGGGERRKNHTVGGMYKGLRVASRSFLRLMARSVCSRGGRWDPLGATQEELPKKGLKIQVMALNDLHRVPQGNFLRLSKVQ